MREWEEAPACTHEREGDRTRLASIYRTRASSLSRYVQALLRGRGDNDDIVQDAFARLASQQSLARVKNPDAYLKRIVRNLLIDRSRRTKTQPIFVPLDGIEPAVPPNQSDAIEIAQMQDQYRMVIEGLPPRTREVFLLHRVEEKSVKDIAATLEISTRTVEWHLAQAILRISTALKQA